MNTFPFVIDDSERVRVSGAASVQAGTALAFGRIVAVSGLRIQVEADLDLEKGALVDIRFELSPVPGTALVSGTVRRRLLIAHGELPRYLIEIANVAAEDRERCGTWLEAARVGGTLSTFSGVSDVQGGLGAPRASLRDALRGLPLRGVTVLE